MAEYVSWPVWATRKSPIGVCTSAALPTDASGEDESIVSVMPLAVRVPFTVGSDGALLGPVGLPLHPSRAIPAPPKTASVTA